MLTALGFTMLAACSSDSKVMPTSSIAQEPAISAGLERNSAAVCIGLKAIEINTTNGVLDLAPEYKVIEPGYTYDHTSWSLTIRDTDDVNGEHIRTLTESISDPVGEYKHKFEKPTVVLDIQAVIDVKAPDGNVYGATSPCPSPITGATFG